MRAIRLLLILIAALHAGGAAAAAADRTILGKNLVVKNPTGAEINRTIVVLGKETSTGILALAGNPTLGGATIEVAANGTTSSSQSFTLPAGGWSTIGHGFKYIAPTGATDPVKKVILKRTPGGVALLRVLLKGNVGTQDLDIVPPNTGNNSVLSLQITGGDRYCVSFGGVAGGTVVRNDAKIWKMKNPATGTCSPFQTCGNDVVEGTEECDGTADAACPALCQGNCTCDLSGDACCESGGTCGGGPAAYCAGTPVGGGAVCDASGDCVAPPASADECCAVTFPFPLCSQADPSTCSGVGGTYFNYAVCTPSGTCEPGCTGATVGGFCWFLGAAGESCDTVCADHGRTYDSATEFYAGSSGTDANCDSVLDALEVTLTISASASDCSLGLGCTVSYPTFYNLRYRCQTPFTTSSASDPTNIVARACACQ